MTDTARELSVVGRMPLWKRIAISFLTIGTLLAILGWIAQILEPYHPAAAKKLAQPSFRDRYNALAKITAPAMATRECVTTNSAGRNRDSLIECPLVSDGAQLTIGGLNNKFTGALLKLDTQKLNNSNDLMKAGRILLRLARGKDVEREDPVEMMQLVIEAQQNLGKGACVDTPEQRTRFCVMTDDKKVYHFAIVDPEMWK